MRASYLAQDCPDLLEAVKTLARYMKEPNEAHFGRLKRLGRFQKKYALLRNVMYPQKMPKRLDVLEDSDHAGCAVTRKSTTGLAVMFVWQTLPEKFVQSTKHHSIKLRGI